MRWNYRITKDKDGYCLREIYYNSNKINGYTAALTGYYATRKQLIDDLKMKAKEAPKRKTLNITKYEKETKTFHTLDKKGEGNAGLLSR